MGHVVYDDLTLEKFLRLPETKPALEYLQGKVVQKWPNRAAGLGHVIYEDLSLKQFLRLPEAKPALEYLGGKVVQKVSPKTTHSVLQMMLGSHILNYAMPRRLGRPYPELRCTFGGESIVHDLCYFERGRIPRDEHGRLVDDVLLPPDLTIEILSPGQTLKNLGAKLTRCMRDGVRLGWLIQPRRSRVFVFRPDRPVETLELGGVLQGEDVLPWFTLPLSEMFGWLVED
jgi:Uma2 family endonuclease